MFKSTNYNIILPKYYNTVKKKGGTRAFSALRGWNKKKDSNPTEKNRWIVTHIATTFNSKSLFCFL